MGYYDYYSGFAPYISVAEHKAKAKKYIAEQRKKGIELSPVELEDRTIAKSWWGKTWCENLKLYADYASRSFSFDGKDLF